MIQRHLVGNCINQADVLQGEQTKLLYAGMPASIIINTLLALILVSVQSAVITPTRLFVWLATLGIILLARVALTVAWRRSGSGAASCAPCWIRRFRINVIATGMAWGMGAVLLFPSGNVTYQATLSFVLAGMSAGAITLLAVDRVSMLGFLVPTLVPLIVRFGVEGGAASPAMGAMVALFLFFVVVNAALGRRSLHESIRLRIQAEEQEQLLLRSEARLNQAQRIAHLGNWELDLVSDKLYWSDEIYRIFEIDQAKFGASHEAFLNAIHPDDRDRVNKAYTGSLANRTPYDIVYRLQFADGRIKFVKEHCETHFDAGGKATHSLGMVQDITEHKLAEEKIHNLNEELEIKVHERTKQLLEAQEDLVRKEKLAVLGQVAGSVGHELRNPLGVMSNAVYFLQTVLSDADETTKEYLDIIKSEIAASERIVSDLLDSVRTKPPRPEIMGVRELLEKTLGKCTVPSTVTVKLYIPETLSRLIVDPQQIHQVFRNLISNGVEAMPEGGTLEIHAVENKQDGTITTSVRDSGTGIAPEVQVKLFQPLYTTKARGIGLGLVVVKNLTEANGGHIEVQSEVGKGTTFFVTLPSDSSTIEAA